MYKFFVLLFVLFCSANALSEQVPASLDKSIRFFAVEEIKLEKDVLSITLKKPVVSFNAYTTLIQLGVCAPLWEDGSSWGNARLVRVEVRNQIQAQGFAFIGGRNECTELGQVRGNQTDAYIAEHTWVCVAGAECRPRRPGEKTSGDK